MITFYADNLVERSTITPSSENLLFPATNIRDPRRTKVFRSTGNSSSVVFDFLETSEIDSVLMVDNYREGFGFITATLELNATSDFTSPAYSISLVFDPATGVGLTELPVLQEYRFARIVLTSTLGYCELSNIFIGKKLNLLGGRGINFGWTFKDKDLSKTVENRYGQRFSDLITRQRVFTVSFSNLTKDHISQVASITDDRGVVKPFFIKIGCTDMTNSLDRYTGMVYLNDIPTETNRAFNLFNMSMSLEEAM